MALKLKFWGFFNSKRLPRVRWLRGALDVRFGLFLCDSKAPGPDPDMAQLSVANQQADLVGANAPEHGKAPNGIKRQEGLGSSRAIFRFHHVVLTVVG